MSLEQLNTYLPDRAEVERAFDVVLSKHRKTGIDFQALDPSAGSTTEIVHDFTLAAVAYFGSRGHDKYMRELGLDCWYAITEEYVQSIYVADLTEVTDAMGISRQVAQSIENYPLVRHDFSSNRWVICQSATLYIPLTFIQLAKNRPIEALTLMSYALSQIKDFVNQQVDFQGDHIGLRASATGAHFILEALRQHPNLQLSSYARGLLEEYPKGIFSLPKGVRYKGFQGSRVGTGTFN